MEEVAFLVAGCGPAGGTAAREAARRGIETLVLERDPVVGARRVCAGGLRPGFCEEFNLPRSIVHCDPPVIALHGPSGERYDFPVGPAHTTTREELDGTIGRLASEAGAQIRTGALLRSFAADGEATIVEYADLASGERRKVRAQSVFLALGSSARLEGQPPFGFTEWEAGLITCLQYRVYPEREATPQTYSTLEMHYYISPRLGRLVIAWMFPKRDHLSIGFGVQAKVGGEKLRAELDAFLPTVADRLFPGIPYRVRQEGNLLYCGTPRPTIGTTGVMLGGTAAGLVDATTGEGIYEAALSGRFAAEAVDAWRRKRAPLPGVHYQRATKGALYRKLRNRVKLLHFLERKPARFDVLFRQLARTPAFAALLQRDRDDFSWRESLYLYAQVGRFALSALRV